VPLPLRAGLPVALCLLASACSGGSNDKADYEVTVTATNAQIAVYGCPTCPAIVNPEGFIGWREKRSLPRTYVISIGGHRSDCPPLTALPAGSTDTGKKWRLTVSLEGTCVVR
jgi:hypothetical protein